MYVPWNPLCTGQYMVTPAQTHAAPSVVTQVARPVQAHVSYGYQHPNGHQEHTLTRSILYCVLLRFWIGRIEQWAYKMVGLCFRWGIKTIYSSHRRWILLSPHRVLFQSANWRVRCATPVFRFSENRFWHRVGGSSGILWILLCRFNHEHDPFFTTPAISHLCQPRIPVDRIDGKR